MCRSLAQLRRADRVHFRLSGGRLGAATGVEPIELASRVVHADETPIALLDPDAGKTKSAYMWAYARGAICQATRRHPAVCGCASVSRGRMATTPYARPLATCITRLGIASIDENMEDLNKCLGQTASDTCEL